MYRLYYLPGACSLAVHAVMQELNVPVDIVPRDEAPEFRDLNPVGAVPVLVDGDLVLREGAAILLHLLDKHDSPMLPRTGSRRSHAIESLMFANATMHPAYGRLFFINQRLVDETVRASAFESAARAIDELWAVVDERLGRSAYMDGEHVSAADFLLTVYARWGARFPVHITLGANTERMVEAVTARPSFQRALEAEARRQAAA